MEEVIQSIEVIETETGYRIEIKGNKAFIKQWVQRFQPGAGQPQGQGEGQPPYGYGFPWQRGWGHGHPHHPGFGFRRRRHGMHAPWWGR